MYRINILTKSVLFICIVSFVLIQIRCDNSKHEELENKSLDYYKEYKIKLKGTIVGIKDIDSRNCLVTISIDTASTKDHDLRFSAKSYYLYIKGDLAYSIECCTQSLNFNDKISIDYLNNDRRIYNSDNMLKGSKPLPILSEDYELLQRQNLNSLNAPKSN